MGLSFQNLGLSLLILVVFSSQAYAFGAGNIASLSRLEGQNWRHGDIEDVLLTLYMARVAGGKKFGKLDVKRVYFGNWLRDYSQAVDVGTVKYVSAEAIRILLWVLGFMSFGYGTGEFEVTTERLGCYQPTEHIDNPLGYATGEDARDYDRRLRGPVDEERELSVDPRTGLKHYIATEDLGIDTSAALIRRVFGQSIQMGRRYGQSRNKDDLYEALRLLGTGLHCLEDYAAHSNYTELSLIELGEIDVFPHVGRDTKLQVNGVADEVYPIVTGTFGGVDFFHSVLGELSDKTMQSEIESLENIVAHSENQDSSESFLQTLLSKIPDGLLGDSNDQTGQMDGFKSKADEAKHDGENVNPREPEEWTLYLNNVQRQIYPVLEWHDNLLKQINAAIEKIPILPGLIEQIQDQITLFVFSILAPYILPIIKQVKSELETGSSEVIQSSQEQQHIVFNDDDCSNPTHSMLSKDHFSNILNEPAGRVASAVVKWSVPQLMSCWDDEDADIDRTLDRIISGVFHHPALRKSGRDGAADMHQIMFSTVEKWWSEKNDEERDILREQLSRDGVLEGRNHKDGVQDCGHGCGKPLALPKSHGSSGEGQGSGGSGGSVIGNFAAEAVGGGAIGGILGGLVGGMGSLLLNNTGSNPDRESPGPQNYDSGNSYQSRPQHESHEQYGGDSFSQIQPPRHSGFSQSSEPSYGGYGQYPVHHEEYRPRPDGYEYQSETVYQQPPPRRDEYSSYAAPAENFHREEHHQYHSESQGYYQEQTWETYQSGQSEYQRSEVHYRYGGPPSREEYGQESSVYGHKRVMVSERAAMDTAPSDNMRTRSAPGTVRALAVRAAMRNILTDTIDTIDTTIITIITMNDLVWIRIR
ncbi:NIMA-interacting protein TinC [Penicillium digitatum PHI26]|uniref:NIMA-interacting protein TinC n=2 Tax=Penicillium digitatum TaxID=36651 RepID=K9G763_PEND2|nr:NIMA-interacting protein TinC [Penicillium digitatum Pd1]EKV11253.1 NIMA-interacting protein TinC [Penicillium digitatum Pd1]EKV16782.1 NIMA-interacting protein TinC [Penicillium digitatum PHI26]